MPVPVAAWESPELGLLYGPADTATVVSEDIWKKFDMDGLEGPHPLLGYEEEALSDVCDELSFSCLGSREIRHHDCMWAGLCISKEHNRILSTRRSAQAPKSVPAGHSLLISRAAPPPRRCRPPKNLESDGDSTRPQTPQSSDEDTETDDEEEEEEDQEERTGRGRTRTQEKLSECLSTTEAAPVSEVTGQLVRSFHERRRMEEAAEPTEVRNTLSDHCYHLNEFDGKRLDHLGVQTPSDSEEEGAEEEEEDEEEEEIDVVTFEKPTRPAGFPTYPSPEEQQRFQATVKTALKERVPTGRPRGRPPSSGTQRKRTAQGEPKPAKRPRPRSYQKRGRPPATPVLPPSPPTPPTPPRTVHQPTPQKAHSSRCSSDDEQDSGKRSLHNNMERQRRIELRNAFEELRVLVPALEAKDKAPKVAILRQAAVYCDILSETAEITEAKVAELKRHQARLRARLSQLRRNLALTR
ncbi:transcriptional regulator Myc-B [Orussus abietinus]|uniref:transcriptional regulator Myc-B n=1 Tax=Orussus abietinus TaxID=222816 RepID=UPI000625C232|nr:transcriptional regulator Myc-B [Orussus abietinus]